MAKTNLVGKKKVRNKFVFFIPVIIFFSGIIVYFIVDSNVALTQVNSSISMKIFWKVWRTGLIISLFLVGKQLQIKPEPNAQNAIFIKKEPYLKIQEVSDALKQLKTHRTSQQLDSLIYAVKKLEEKLSVESDFGYGKSVVINYENNIARQIQFLLTTVPYVENGDFEKNLKAMSNAVININSLLRKRTELKKR